MNKEELITFLRENLSIQIHAENDYMYGKATVKVTLLIDREEIDTDSTTISIPTPP